MSAPLGIPPTQMVIPGRMASAGRHKQTRADNLGVQNASVCWRCPKISSLFLENGKTGHDRRYTGTTDIGRGMSAATAMSAGRWPRASSRPRSPSASILGPHLPATAATAAGREQLAAPRGPSSLPTTATIAHHLRYLPMPRNRPTNQAEVVCAIVPDPIFLRSGRAPPRVDSSHQPRPNLL
jgi:hypothetical protein